MSKITTMKFWKFNETTLFNDCLITLISYMRTQHYACVVTRRHVSLDALLHTSQTYGRSPLHVSMCYQTGLITVCLVTNISNTMALTTMHALMFSKTALVNECFVTNITSIRPATTMSAIMCYKMAIMTEWLKTHFTLIWSLTTMHV
jgi:hypothetical protein